ncbi:MAG: hypothetical protein HY392_02430 [Candidatus Diapherotrites archaeon]|nr:hypothetical protein [Candidatus Diapherotrites archaeon]
MNRFDKKLHTALNFFANNDLTSANDLKKQEEPKFRQFVPIDIERFAFEERYLDADRRSNAITAKGLEQLRTLENSMNNERAFWISIAALVFSIISFTISLGFGIGG